MLKSRHKLYNSKLSELPIWTVLTGDGFVDTRVSVGKESAPLDDCHGKAPKQHVDILPAGGG